MKILVINGSPKGDASVTLQTARYLEQSWPAHSFAYLNAGAKIRALEKDFTPAAQAVEEAELLLFCYPVYTFLAPSQLHRFIELLKQSGINLRGKWASQITTSKHFYDVTAHRYIADNCADLGLHFVGGLSADMDDLLTPVGRKQARAYFHHLLWSVKNGVAEPDPLPAVSYRPVMPSPAQAAEKTQGDVVILCDGLEDNPRLRAMVERFCAVLPRRSRVLALDELPMRGGCLGCFHCATDGACVYTDGFDRYLREQIQTAEAVIYAFSIRDHSMGAKMKQYDDRQFCNGHRTVTMGMPMGYLISGPYSGETNLQMVVQARCQVGGNYLAGVATDETDPDGQIDRLARNLDYAIGTNYQPPQNFYGVGGMKIFRDLIYLMRGMMKADHRFYKAHGQYDFPQKKKGTVLKMYLVGALLSSPKVKAKMGDRMTQGMLAPYEKALKSTKPS